MATLTTSDAQALVRRNLDELDPNGSIMYQDENGTVGDNTSMDSLIGRFLPEAINAVHLAAPVALLEGVSLTIGTPTPGSTEQYDVTDATITSNVLSFSIAASLKYLRLVAFRAKGSNIVITDPIPEASAEGRKQLNPHIRGRADRPRLVILQDLQNGPRFKYYSLTDETTIANDAIDQLSIVKEQTYIAPTQELPDPSYNISALLRQNIIDYLTARVMETFNDQRSQIYTQRANSYPTL